MTENSLGGVLLLVAWARVDTLPQLHAVQVGIGAHKAAVRIVAVHLVGALVAWGHPPTFAATVAGLPGVLSVAGAGTHRRPPEPLVHRAGDSSGVFAVQAVAALLLPVVGGNAMGTVAAVTACGLGFGVATPAAVSIAAVDRVLSRPRGA